MGHTLVPPGPENFKNPGEDCGHMRSDEHRLARQNVRWDNSRTPKKTPHVRPVNSNSLIYNTHSLVAKMVARDKKQPSAT